MYISKFGFILFKKVTSYISLISTNRKSSEDRVEVSPKYQLRTKKNVREW